MANRQDSDHHNNDNGDDVNNLVLTSAEFLNFRDENHQFCEKSQKIIGEIQQKIATLLTRNSSHNDNDQYIQKRTPNYKKIPLFDGDMCKLDFIDCLLDLEEYFNFWKICDEEKVQLASNKLDNEVEEWWEEIQIDRKRQGKHPICSWQRMKKVLIDLWFPNDYYDILNYASVDYKSLYSYENHYVHNMKGQNQNYHSQVHVSSKGKSLRVEKKQPTTKEKFEVVKRDQDLQQVIELKIEDTTCQKFDEEFKETKVEFMEDNDRNEEMVIIENIVEDSIEVKYEDESTTHNSQVSVDLLKMTT